MIKQIHKEEELGHKVEIDLAKAIKEFKEQYDGATDRFLTDLTVFIRRNINQNYHPEIVNMDEDEEEDFFTWGRNSRYKNVFEPLLYERFEEAIEKLEEYLVEREFYMQVNIKVDILTPATSIDKAIENIKEQWRDDYRIELEDSEIIFLDVEEGEE